MIVKNFIMIRRCGKADLHAFQATSGYTIGSPAEYSCLYNVPKTILMKIKIAILSNQPYSIIIIKFCIRIRLDMVVWRGTTSLVSILSKRLAVFASTEISDVVGTTPPNQARS